jgi:RHS repeat-associated protein
LQRIPKNLVGKGNNTALNPLENGRGDRFAYDDEGQLTDAWYEAVDPVNSGNGATRQDHFNYDQLGNRKGQNTVASLGAVTMHRRDNGLNQYLDWTQSAINYENNGNLYQDGWITASYNALNQPITIWSWRTNPTGNNLNFGYDPLGRCVKRWDGMASDPYANPATYFHYDGWNLLQEGSNPWSPARVYVHGARIDEIVYSVNEQTGESAFHHYDGRGHCTLLTNSLGNISEQYQYDAFGYPYFFDGSGNVLPNGSAFGNRFLFTGREWIKEIGVYDFRSRHYLPELGRFIQPDPKEFDAGDYNLYRYCHNDPVNRSDPTGLSGSNVMFDSAAIRHFFDGDLSADELRDVMNPVRNLSSEPSSQTSARGAAGYEGNQ